MGAFSHSWPFRLLSKGRLALRDERGSAMLGASIFIPASLVLLAVGFDTFQYFSATKLLHAAANDAASAAHQAKKKRLSPEEAARTAFESAAKDVAALSKLELVTTGPRNNERFQVEARVRLILPISTRILGWGMEQSFKGRSDRLASRETTPVSAQTDAGAQASSHNTTTPGAPMQLQKD